MKLKDTLHKTIADFCSNRFTNPSDNHCAHYVCHVLEIDAGYDCKVHTGNRHPGSCLRVHELFHTCPRVGLFENAAEPPCIAFVTAKTNVSLAEHHMRNVPQKHVGIYDGTHIYHYSNGNDIVVRNTPTEFLDRFQTIYSGDQALYFGTMPAGAKLPETENIPVAIVVAESVGSGPEIAIRSETSGGRTAYFAKIDEGTEFYVSHATTYQSYKGLYQPGKKLYGPQYNPRDSISIYGPAAAMVGAIAEGESSGYFNRLNSYDRAEFTFGFFQLAAHTPKDNLILLFRRLAVESDGFRRMFPDLSLREGRLHREVTEGHHLSLEREYPRPGHQNEMNLKDFMEYLNPSGASVDKQELEVAAKLVSLANSDLDTNAIQVNLAVEITMGKLRSRYDRWYGLDGESDLVCTAIGDIHHQGRGTKTHVREALKANSVSGKLTALCRIGEASYAERCQTLRNALAKFKEDGLLGTSVFDTASGLFRPTTGWVA